MVPIETWSSNMWALTSWYTADSDTVRLTFALKSAMFLPDGCCYLNDSLQNQLVICTSSFSCTLCHNSYVWPGANPHAASVHCLQQCCVVNVWVSLVHGILIGPYLLPWWLSAQIYWRKSYQKHLVPVWQGCGSLCTSGLITSHHQLQRSLDCTRWACGFACQISWPHTNGLLPMGPH